MQIHHFIHNNLQTALISLQNQHTTNSIYTFCKWGVLVIAFFATFRTITNILIIRFTQTAPSLSSIANDEDDFSDIEEDDDETTSSVSSSDSDSNSDESEEDKIKHKDGEYFRVRGSSSNDDGVFLRRRSIGDLFSLAEIANSKSVVKLWDAIGLGLGLGFDNSDCDDVISVYDDNEERRIRPLPCGKPPAPVVSWASPAVVVLGGESSSGNFSVKVWDNRIRQRSPAVVAEWGNITSDGVENVDVRDDDRYVLRVGDIRNVKLPLANVKASYIRR
ncbi:hypothetical protein PIB30_001992 [Stylosanthes scabra]|uniref:Uncharacterized protein n=1 Tax=Stylosanthes scabra TaxID=79078 RepID=A0ABU6Z3R1_9FABA|nr:hypothetical protein [Stylosanthes scabra]